MKKALVIAMLLLVAGGCRRRRPPEPPPPGTSLTAAHAGGEAPIRPSAEVECGTDRRCRLARLRRLGHARAASRARAAEAHDEAIQNAITQVEHDRSPRRRHPWVIENVVTDHWFGATAGLHPIPNLFVGVGASWVFGFSQYRWGETETSYASISSMLAIQTELRWLVFDHNVTPYLSGGFHVMLLGGMYVQASTDGGLTNVNAYPKLDVHAASIGLGMDVHTDFGLRFRIGAIMRPLIYVRATENDMPVEVAEEAFAAGWRLFGVEGALGWSW